MKRKIKLLTEERTSLSALTFATGMLIIFSFIENPWKFTISMIGEIHPVLFVMLCTSMCFSTMINQFKLFERTDYKRKYMYALSIICNLAMIATSVTQSTDTTASEVIFHWTTALMFMVVNPFLILFCAIHKIRKGNRKYIIPIAVFLPLYIADIIYMIRLFSLHGASDGKNGVLEIVPIFMTFILLYICNFTKLLETKSHQSSISAITG